MISIRKQLLIALFSVLALAMMMAGRATYVAALDEADRLFDYHLQQIALSLRDQTFRGSAQALVNDESLDYVIRIWDASGASIYYSKPRQVLPEITQLGYSSPTTQEGEWRVFSIQYRGLVISVAQPMQVRQRLATEAAWRTLKPFFIMLPLLGVLVWYLVGYALRPMTSLARMVQKRNPDSLETLYEGNVPEELKPLVFSLNDLLTRLKLSMDAQRAFVADAAHELRTPLTALQLQSELVEKASSDEERQSSINELKVALKRTTHLVQQMLDLARQEPGATPYRWDEINLVDLAREVVVEQSLLAESKNIDLGLLPSDDAVLVKGDRQSLRQLLSNLVNNALRYTPSGGTVDVCCKRVEQGSSLEVIDNGPGIPSEERNRVFDRFYRSANADTEGTGLGLSIVRLIAERHHASICLEEADGGGLKVCVVFPANTDAVIS